MLKTDVCRCVKCVQPFLVLWTVSIARILCHTVFIQTSSVGVDFSECPVVLVFI